MFPIFINLLSALIFSYGSGDMAGRDLDRILIPNSSLGLISSPVCSWGWPCIVEFYFFLFDGRRVELLSLSLVSDGLAGELYNSSVLILSTFSFVVTPELVWMETPDLVSSLSRS